MEEPVHTIFGEDYFDTWQYDMDREFLEMIENMIGSGELTPEPFSKEPETEEVIIDF